MSFTDKVKQMLGRHSDKVSQAVDKAGDMVDRKTGGRYSEKVDTAQDKTKDYVDKSRAEGGGQRRPEDGTPPS